MAIDINRGTTGIVLPSEVSSEIWGSTVENSAVMTAARQISLPGSGTSIQIITGEPEAQWVDETDPKPTGTHSFANKAIRPYTLAIIEPFSNQFRRDLPSLYAELVRRLPYALGKKFDRTVFGEVDAPGSDFDTLDTAASMSVGKDIYQDLVAAYNAVTTAGGTPSAWAAQPELQGKLLAATDGFGRPLFASDATTTNVIGSMLGLPVVKVGNTGSDNIGVVGAFQESAVWGSVEGIEIDISDQATLGTSGNQINLFERNMFAVRAEIEVGFRVKDINHFVKLTNDTAGDEG